METSMPLASDSFSYSWLSNSNKPPLDYLHDEPHRDSMSSFYGDSTSNNSQNFNFDTCISQSNLVLVHADEIFSNGLLRPFFLDPSKVEVFYNTSDPIQTKIETTSLSSITFSTRSVKSHHHGFLIRLRKSTWRTLVQFFKYFNQLRQKMERSRKSTKVDDIDKTDWLVKSLRNSHKASLIGDFHVEHDDSSIYEAVLHCKKSIGK
ncbi:unnamed protein product [Trifolium pratense]|uniref:Uncharacterized protein n=1 Tax=Trifolium pratense TaxID=57577 RepID=A0ACB0JWD1_TRIPR|nr:unnamed protein product [Trifolium pratense]